MILTIVTIYDSVAQVFSPPVFVRSVPHAVRSFLNECRGSGSDLANNPTDFQLMELGSFDDCSGQFVTHAVPVLLAKGVKEVLPDGFLQSVQSSSCG